ncbi:MAG: FtsX-like permease family protein [Planctomycetes bacterium]|nr:FtsX-like permease family protein [Planctomycetota bacterium]
MLTLPRLIVRNLAFHWRGNLAVLLGVVVGSAVLTGALLVGDSLRGSLRARVERQLGGIDAAAMLPRLVRADIVNELSGNVAPVLLVPGSAQGLTADAPFLGRVTVLGVDSRFQPTEQFVDWNSTAKQVVLSDRVATKLGVKTGERVRLNVERITDIPRATALAKRGAADVTATEEFAVAGVLPPDSSAGDFNLTPNPAASLNVYVPIRTLTRLVAGGTDPKANVLLARNAATDELNAALKMKLTAENYGIKVRAIEKPKRYLSVESDQMVFPSTMVKGIEATASELKMRREQTVIYIADTLAFGEKEIPYPVIAGLNVAAAAPLGPFLPNGVSTLADDEVVLLEWTGSQLSKLPDGSKLRLSYYDPEVEGDGKLKETTLTLRGYIPLAGAARDPNLTPEIKGVTEAKTDLRSLDFPPVLPNAKIKERVPDKPPHPRGTFFNSLNKATPMAYVNLATGKKLFGSRYGSVTSIRVAPPEGSPDTDEYQDEQRDRLLAALPSHLDQKAAGLMFDPVRERLLTASKGGTDFGGLFLGFSCFLIAAALMLVGLLFRLTLDRRAKEVGLLLATGYSTKQVRRLLLLEGLTLAVIGASLGLALGVAYNRLLLSVLLDFWPDKEVANVLRPHTTTLSFVLGFGLTVLMALIALWMSLRGLVKLSPPALLRGETQLPAFAQESRSRLPKLIVIGAVPFGIALVISGKFISNPDFQAMSFFSGGGLLLTAGLAALWWWMKQTRHAIVNGRGASALARLGTRNAARNPTRSLLTAALLASAAFLLVAVESFRRQPGAEFLDKNGGSGGFNLIAETDVPLYQSFGGGPGRADLERQLRKLHAPAESEPDNPPSTPGYLADKTGLDSGLEEVFPLRLRSGDDASCMNLAQASRPRVLGVTDSLIERGGFKFYMTEASTPEEKANPWLLLKKPIAGGAIPVFCEQNTAQWMLKTAVGGDIKMAGDDANELTFRIVGTFADSPFQSELVMSDESFAGAFPKTGGYRVFLIRTPAEKEKDVATILAKAFRPNGMIVTSTREKVAEYQAVIGAYLSTFQLLGGLGLLLGVMGLAVVVLRGVWERVGELALLRAVGYRTRQLQFLVLAENALLLVVGLSIGVVAALISVAPHVVAGADVPWGRLAAILGLVFIVGLGVAFSATAGILRVPVIPALRRE